MKELPIYAPSSTELWKTCPLKHYLQRVERLELRSSRSLLPRIVGSAISEGVREINEYWKDHGTGATVPPYILASAKATAVAYLGLETDHVIKAGAVVDTMVLPSKNSEVCRVIERYHELKPLQGYKVTGVEQTLPNHGNCRLDIVTTTPGGEVAVIDVKYKANLDEKYRAKTITRYLRSWQFAHYPWAYQEHSGIPVSLMYLMLITMRPRFDIQLIPYRVNPDIQRVWLQSAKVAWQDMYDERQNVRPLTTAAVHEDAYGPCEMASVCFDYGLDTEQATKGEYVRIPRFDFQTARQLQEKGLA